jgi:hypothetical protein
VGILRQEAIVNLNNQIGSNHDWLPQEFNISGLIIKPMCIDDLPVMVLTLSNKSFINLPSLSYKYLTHIAHSLETELRTISGTRDVYTLDGMDQYSLLTLIIHAWMAMTLPLLILASA